MMNPVYKVAEKWAAGAAKSRILFFSRQFYGIIGSKHSFFFGPLRRKTKKRKAAVQDSVTIE